MEEKYQLTSKNNIGQYSSYFSQMRLVCESKNLAELHEEVLGQGCDEGALSKRTPEGRSRKNTYWERNVEKQTQVKCSF